jgi:hypothetical protein
VRGTGGFDRDRPAQRQPGVHEDEDVRKPAQRARPRERAPDDEPEDRHDHERPDRDTDERRRRITHLKEEHREEGRQQDAAGDVQRALGGDLHLGEQCA